jgi:hypothetical protein
MKTSTSHPSPTFGSTRDDRCKTCNHDTMGRIIWLGHLIAKLLPSISRASCATFSREGGMDDILYCSCTNIVHAGHIAPTKNHIQVESLR